jgi:hypothetical protein
MNRQERRSIEAMEKKAVRQLAKLKTHEALALKARQFVAEDEAYDFGLTDLLERPDFDDALVNLIPRLEETLPELDVTEFYSDLMTCAQERIDVIGNHAVRYTLFAISICGPSDAVSDVVKGDRPTIIAKSFRASGLAASTDSIFVIPRLLHDGDVASLLPGMLTEIVCGVASFAATNCGNLTDTIDGLLGAATPEDTSPEKFASRMLLGVQMQLLADDPEELPDSVLDCEADEILERWRALADAAVGPKVIVHFPTGAVEGGTLMSLDRVTVALDMEARALGFGGDRRYDEMRVWRDGEDLLWVSAKVGGKSIGPIDCSAPLALASPDLFFSHLADLSEKMLDGPEPSPSAVRH